MSDRLIFGLDMGCALQKSIAWGAQSVVVQTTYLFNLIGLYDSIDPGWVLGAEQGSTVKPRIPRWNEPLKLSSNFKCGQHLIGRIYSNIEQRQIGFK